MSWFSDLFKSKENTVTQEEMLTPEQKQAMSMLMDFAKTGKFGNFQAGQEYTGKLGDYDMSELEKTGQSKLLSLLTGGMPDIYNQGRDEISKLLTTDKYDPYAKGGVYEGYKKNVLRERDESTDALKRDMAVTGGLYSTATGKEAGLLGERATGQLNDKLAQLYDVFAQRKLAGAETAANMGLQEENVAQNRIAASQQYGQLQRMLADAQAKDKYADWTRARSEYGDTIDAAKTVLGKQVPYGVKSITTKEPSPFSNLLNTGLNLAGNYFGSYLGGLGLKDSGLFGSNKSTSAYKSPEQDWFAQNYGW